MEKICFPSEEDAQDAYRRVRDNHDPSARDLVSLGKFLIEEDDVAWCSLSAPECFQRALELPEGRSSNRIRAEALCGMGSYLTDQGSGYRDETLLRAVDALEESISLFSADNDEHGLLHARFHLGYALSEIVGRERYQATERAIEELEWVRARLTRRDDGVFRANVDMVLGSAYLDAVDRDPFENFHRAETLFRSALKVFNRRKNSEGRAQGYFNLAVLYNYRSINGDRAAPAKAIRYARLALKYCGDTVPAELLAGVLSNLARALGESSGRHTKGKLRQAETLINEGIMLSQEAQSGGTDVLRLVRAGLLFGLFDEYGIDRLDEVKADLDAASHAFDPRNTTQWWLEWCEIKAKYLMTDQNYTEVIDLAEEVLENLNASLMRGRSFGEQRLLLSLVSYVADLGILAHLENTGPFDGLSFARRVNGRLLGYEGVPLELTPGSLDLYFLNPVVEDWSYVLMAAGDYCEKIPVDGIGRLFWDHATERRRIGFFTGLDDLMAYGRVQPFSQALETWIEDLSAALEGLLSDVTELPLNEVVVSAFGAWCAVPFAALVLPERSRGRLIDHAAIVHAPDHHLPHSINLRSLLHVVDPELQEASSEVELIANLGVKRDEVRFRSAVEAALTNKQPYDVIHFTTHAEHDFDYLEGAGIRLADGEMLTARWVFEEAQLSGGPLVCLAACQTGLTDFLNMPHEAFGLPTAFLAAGASAVISTLWPVDDLATRLLVGRVYQEIQAGASTAEALRNAQLWLRALPQSKLGERTPGSLRFSRQGRGRVNASDCPFSHPYYWGGFQLHRA